MEAFTDTFAFMAGGPAMIGLILTAVTIFLSSDWRLSLTALMVQYVLVGLALTRFIQAEIAVVKILVGVLVVAILYLGARHMREVRDSQETEDRGVRFLGLQVGWGGGPLGLPLRLLGVLLVALGVIRFFDDYRLLLPVLGADNTTVPADIAFAAFWLGGMGLVGLILSGVPLRVAPALLTVLSGFDLVYSSLEPDVAVIGFSGALILLAALAFSYLITIQGLGAGLSQPDLVADSLPEGLPDAAGADEKGVER